MFWKRKKETQDNSVADEANADNTDIEGHDTSDTPVHAMGDGDGVPPAVKDVLAKIRGEQDSGYVDVEVDDDGNPVNAEDAALLKGNAAVKDDDATGGDTVNQGSEGGRKSEAAAVDDSSSDYEDVELDPRLEAAGKAMGWSDDKIALVAETDMTILEDIATRLDASDSHRQDNKDGSVTDGDTGEQGGLVDEKALAELKEKLGDGGQEFIDSLVKGIEAKFAAKFQAVDDLQAHNKKESENRAAIQRGSIADAVFDSVSEKFEEFGLTKALPKGEDGRVILDSPQMNVRAKVYKVATIFHQANGGTFEQAMYDAVQHYAGGQGTTKATRQVVKELKENKKRFTPKPTGRKTVRVFKNTDAKASHIVQQAMRKAGIKT